jgi:hypothetical protein
MNVYISSEVTHPTASLFFLTGLKASLKGMLR